MAELKRSTTWVQFDVGATQRFQVYVAGVVLPTAGLTCQVRLQKVDDDGAAVGSPIVADATADAGDYWKFTVVSGMTAVAGEYEFEARLDNGSGEVKRWPDEQRAVVTIRPVRTGGTS